MFRCFLFAPIWIANSVAFKRYAARATAFTGIVNKDDFMKADHGELEYGHLSVFLLGLALEMEAENGLVHHAGE